eukprot:5000346-Pyramimonas_sp.AAC.1
MVSDKYCTVLCCAVLRCAVLNNTNVCRTPTRAGADPGGQLRGVRPARYCTLILHCTALHCTDFLCALRAGVAASVLRASGPQEQPPAAQAVPLREKMQVRTPTRLPQLSA